MAGVVTQIFLIHRYLGASCTGHTACLHRFHNHNQNLWITPVGRVRSAGSMVERYAAQDALRRT